MQHRRSSFLHDWRGRGHPHRCWRCCHGGCGCSCLHGISSLFQNQSGSASCRVRLHCRLGWLRFWWRVWCYPHRCWRCCHGGCGCSCLHGISSLFQNQSGSASCRVRLHCRLGWLRFWWWVCLRNWCRYLPWRSKPGVSSLHLELWTPTGRHSASLHSSLDSTATHYH